MEDLSHLPSKYKMAYRLSKHILGESKVRNGDRFWSGSMTLTFDALEIPRSYYTDIVSFLKEVKFIRLLQKGGNTVLSIWGVANEVPSLDDWDKFQKTSKHYKETNRDAFVTAVKDAAALTKMVDDLQKEFNIIKKVLVVMDNRLEVLEGNFNG